MRDLLKRLQTLVLGPAARKFERVSDAMVRDAFDRLRPALEAELEALVAEIQGLPGVAFLVFDVWAEFAFDEFPIKVEVFGPRGEQLVAAARVDGRQLLPDTTLLPKGQKYPLGQHDLAGWDTTPDFAVVERVCIDEFHKVWSDAVGSIPGVRVLIGRWAPNLELERPLPLVDAVTGASVIVDAVWSGEDRGA